MNTCKMTSRLLAVALAVGSCACRQSGALGADSPDTSEKQSKPVERPVRSEIPLSEEAARSTPPAVAAPKPTKVVNTPKAITLPAEVFGAGGSSGVDPFRGRLANSVFEYTPGTRETPAVITTEAIEAKVQNEWREDLSVMDKLVREAMQGNDHTWVAMGIKVGMDTSRRGAMYVEGAGVLISQNVYWPLAAGGREETEGSSKLADSAWDRAKRELKGGPTDKQLSVEPPPRFDQKKLEGLIENLIELLPQASNFRHLKADEAVIVTIGGRDEGNRSVRLTLKAKKSDINDAAAGKIDAATFKQRVSRRVG
jgi:hypothetical protein